MDIFHHLVEVFWSNQGFRAQDSGDKGGLLGETFQILEKLVLGCISSPFWAVHCLAKMIRKGVLSRRQKCRTQSSERTPFLALMILSSTSGQLSYVEDYTKISRRHFRGCARRGCWDLARSVLKVCSPSTHTDHAYKACTRVFGASTIVPHED